MTLAVPVGPPTVTINRDDRVVVCQPDGRIEAAEQEGFFARDSRFISGYEFLVNGRRPVLLNSSAIEFFSSRFEFTNPDLIDEEGVIRWSHVSPIGVNPGADGILAALESMPAPRVAA